MPEQLAVPHENAGGGDGGFELAYAHGVKVVATCRVMAGRVGHDRSVSSGQTKAVGYPHDLGRAI